MTRALLRVMYGRFAVRSTVNGKPLHRCNLTISGDEIVKKISKNIHRNNPLLALLNTVRCGRNFSGPDTPISQWKNQWGLDWGRRSWPIDDCVLEEVPNRLRFEDGVIFLPEINFGSFQYKAQFK